VELRRVGYHEQAGRLGVAGIGERIVIFESGLTSRDLVANLWHSIAMPSAERPTEVTLRDPLTSATRAERRSLLTVSTAGLIIAWTGLVPTHIDPLGITLEDGRGAVLLQLFAGIVLYYWAAFVVYAVSDFAAWRVAYGYAVRESIRRSRTETDDEKYARVAAEQQDRPGRGFAFWYNASKRISVIRAIFDLALPIVLGVVAAAALLMTPAPS
jgi:hypothetical protein